MVSAVACGGGESDEQYGFSFFVKKKSSSSYAKSKGMVLLVSSGKTLVKLSSSSAKGNSSSSSLRLLAPAKTLTKLRPTPERREDKKEGGTAVFGNGSLTGDGELACSGLLAGRTGALWFVVVAAVFVVSCKYKTLHRSLFLRWRQKPLADNTVKPQQHCMGPFAAGWLKDREG